jgi:branched-chain amino acid transport system substrate-binding protein
MFKKLAFMIMGKYVVNFSRLFFSALVSLTLVFGSPILIQADQPQKNLYIGILVPLTGFLALEGESQRNGALLALENPPAVLKQANISIEYEVFDTGTTLEGATLAFNRLLRRDNLVAISGPILGTQMLALLPLAQKSEIPLTTISGTSSLTEQGNRWLFRFFPNDSVVKKAQTLYAANFRKIQRPIIFYQTTAYGQSGLQYLQQYLADLKIDPVESISIDPNIRDLAPILLRVMQKNPDGFLLQLHAPSTALLIQQARQLNIELPIIAGSAMHQPSTAKLLSAAELKNVCAETSAAPVVDSNPTMRAFVADYQQRFGKEPDAFAVAQYDAMNMLMQEIARAVENHHDQALMTIATLRNQLRFGLSQQPFNGLAMSYQADAKGNMAHSAIIICYNGYNHQSEIVERYNP